MPVQPGFGKRLIASYPLILFSHSHCHIREPPLWPYLTLTDKNTGVSSHCLLQQTTFCQNPSLWPNHLEWPWKAWLIVSLVTQASSPRQDIYKYWNIYWNLYLFIWSKSIYLFVDYINISIDSYWYITISILKHVIFWRLVIKMTYFYFSISVWSGFEEKIILHCMTLSSQVALLIKNLPTKAGNTRDTGQIFLP